MGISRTFLLTALALAGWAAQPAAAEVQQYDVVVYGATAGGVIAAIAAAEEGLNVALLEPGTHVGGMVSGGLGRTDYGNQGVVGGMSRAFFKRLGEHYGEAISWFFEPHVAEGVFRAWLKEAGVDVFHEHRLAATETDEGVIQQVQMQNGAEFRALVFMDASYEGDLMAQAGVRYTWGREGSEVYGESLAGRIAHSDKHQFEVDLSPYDEEGELLPFIQGRDPSAPGTGDKKVQAYNFRLCLTNVPENRVDFPKPEDYDPEKYALLRRYLEASPDLEMNEIMIVSPMPNGKTDINNRGAFSTDYIGASWEYPEGDYAKRQEIWDEHVRYIQGFLYFLANDPSVPEALQEEVQQWGLSKDEFVDTDHWPHQLYVREARRMVGAYVMTQKDLQTERTKRDSIGMGSYNSDSHHVQRIVETIDGKDVVRNEGDMQVPVQPYEIAYAALTPKKEECSNLLVVSCVSASHVAYSSIRMEPQYMIMGQAAGLAAAQAVQQQIAVQEIDVPKLQEELREGEAVLSMADVVAPYANVHKLPGIVVDNPDANIVGNWHRSSTIGPFAGHDYLHDDHAGQPGNVVRYVPDLPAPGHYEIRISWSADPNRATNVPVRIGTAEGVVEMHLNQRKAPGGENPFKTLGAWKLTPEDAWVEIATDGTDGHVIADAVQWLPAQAETAPAKQ